MVVERSLFPNMVSSTYLVTCCQPTCLNKTRYMGTWVSNIHPDVQGLHKRHKRVYRVRCNSEFLAQYNHQATSDIDSVELGQSKAEFGGSSS